MSSLTVHSSMLRLARQSLVWGGVGAGGMSTFYVAVVAGLSGSFRHLVDQVAIDWWILLPIIIGFGVQVAVMVELKARQHLMAAAAGSGAAGAGTSTVGMVACCAHHLAELLPFLGATAAAAFLYQYRLAFMLVGLSVNVVALGFGVRQLRRQSRHLPEVLSCHAA